MLSAIAVACSGSGSPSREAQRAHAEGGVAEVEKPDALGRVGRGELQAEAAEFALGVQDDDGGVVVADVVEVGAQHGGGLAAALAADEQRAVAAVVGVDQPGAVGGAQHRQHGVGERAVAHACRR